jgi:uncharacterized protein YbjQ (UPF0145 family)
MITITPNPLEVFIIVATTNSLEGFRVIDYLGLVTGIAVRSPTVLQGLTGEVDAYLGGSVDSYAEMCDQARHRAFKVMLENAKQRGANAVLGIRYDSTGLGSDKLAEVFCFGTAVVAEPMV